MGLAFAAVFVAGEPVEGGRCADLEHGLELGGWRLKCFTRSEPVDERHAVSGGSSPLGGAVEVTAHPVNELIAQGDTVVAMGDVSFRVRSTGKPGQSSWVYVWKLRDGQVYGYDQFNDPGLTDAFR